MRSNNKISAFTLTEILVVLVISAIVVGMAFSVLDLVQKNMRAIKANYAATTEVQSVKQQLTIDFNRYQSLYYKAGLKELVLKTPADSVSYRFFDHRLIRKNDTIKVSVEAFKFFFLGNEVSEGKVDAIKLFLNKSNDDLIFISRKNDAKTYFD